MIDVSQKPLAGKKGLVLGIANEHSIAYGCAQAFRALGAELAITYSNEKTKTHTEPLAQELAASIFLPCDVRQPGQLEAVFQAIEQKWAGLDFALHAIAFAPKEDLHGRLADCSGDGFLAMDISCYSFIRMPGGAAQAQRRRSFHDELLRRRESHRALQRDGTREGCVGKRSALSRLRVGPKGDTGSRDLARTNKNARGIRNRPF